MKSPIQILSEISKYEVFQLEHWFRWKTTIITPDEAVQAIEEYHKQFGCIDKQLAIRFAQSLTNHEVTEGDLTEFLNKQ